MLSPSPRSVASQVVPSCHCRCLKRRCPDVAPHCTDHCQATPTVMVRYKQPSDNHVTTQDRPRGSGCLNMSLETPFFLAVLAELPIPVEAVVDSGTTMPRAKHGLKRRCLQGRNDVKGATIARPAARLVFLPRYLLV
jgi:hypothetical protein